MAEQQTHGQHAKKQPESENLRQAAEKLDLKGKKVAILVAPGPFSLTSRHCVNARGSISRRAP